MPIHSGLCSWGLFTPPSLFSSKPTPYIDLSERSGHKGAPRTYEGSLRAARAFLCLPRFPPRARFSLEPPFFCFSALTPTSVLEAVSPLSPTASARPSPPAPLHGVACGSAVGAAASLFTAIYDKETGLSRQAASGLLAGGFMACHMCQAYRARSGLSRQAASGSLGKGHTGE